MTFLWVVIYLVAGFGAYWLICQEDHYIRNTICRKFGEKADDVYADYYHRVAFVPKFHSAGMYFLLAIVAFIGAWVLWPILAAFGAIFEWCMYKRINKIWSKKLNI